MRLLLPLLLVLSACRPLDGAVDKVEDARARNDGPAIWLVTDESTQGDSRLYLYGTLHIIPAGLDWQRDDMWDAFSSAGTVWFETPSDESTSARIDALTRSRGFLPLGERITDRLDDYETRLLEVAALSADIPFEVLDTMRPWLASELLTLAAAEQAGLSARISPDEALKSRARRTAKFTAYLDSPLEQFALSADADPEVQLRTLRSTLERYNRIAGELRTIAEEWVEGDVETLDTRLAESITGAPRQTLMTDRNARWADTLGQWMDGFGTGFAAVGVGHLVGEDSLPDMLAERGYTVRRYYAFQGENLIRTESLEVDTGG